MLPNFAKIRIDMNKLKICNISLLAITPAVLATSIILEASHGQSVLGLKFNFWVIIHLVAVLAMTGLVCWHLRMNWGKISGWAKKISGKASGASKALAILIAFTALTGLASVQQWLIHGHSPIGGVHGKIGFLFILIAVEFIKLLDCIQIYFFHCRLLLQ